MESTNVWPAAVVILALLVICTGILYFSMPVVPESIKADTSAIETSVASLKADVAGLKTDIANIKLPVPTEAVTPDNEKIDKIYKEILATDLKEAKAEELISALLDKEDFSQDVREAIFDALVASEVSIEDEDDITKLVVVEKETEVDGETASVLVTARVYYFIDGDEEENEKAKVEITFSVEGLDADKDYEDAEVMDDVEVEVLKIYD